ncbi:MAG TPA: hypothetical protein VLE53_17580 [Gemmatimonadaceae bacterium]|nr:hypothetical protein [Gemmatimonadaceae bacterium]
MRHFFGSTLAVAALLLPLAAQGQDASRAVAGGGITVQGWQGKVDPREAQSGMTVNNAKFAPEGQGMHAVTGPSITYWNPANRATGDYTVKATFKEPKFQSLNDHPHPYGIVIGGNDMGTDNQSFLYCAAYGNGMFIVRGFGPAAFQMNGRRGEANPAVKKVEVGQEVTQEIAVSVKGDKVECAINGTVVGSYPKADVVAAGKLKSTDGVYGLRFGHNTEAIVTGLTITKP